MSTNRPDPYRTLGVARGATEAEIKRAYRALAKRHHPDAGHGSAVRFLEIQAAYEALLGGLPGIAPGSGAGRDADPAGRRRAQPGAGSRTGGTARPGSTGPGPRGTGSRPPASEGSRGRRHGRRRATLGSTSYDEAEETFEPGWGGAAWYGPSSGTYWTLNPREYADPRKHGPEYQARAHRRAAGAERAAGPERAAGEPARDRRASGDRPTQGETSAPRPPAAGTAPRPVEGPDPHASPGERAAAAGPGTAARIAVAIGGWLVPGLALGSVVGLPGGLLATLPLQALGVAALALAPRAAWSAAGGGLALVFAAAPIVALVAALGGPFVPGGPAPAAAVVLAVVAWLGGTLAVASGRAARYPWEARPARR